MCASEIAESNRAADWALSLIAMKFAYLPGRRSSGHPGGCDRQAGPRFRLSNRKQRKVVVFVHQLHSDNEALSWGLSQRSTCVTFRHLPCPAAQVSTMRVLPPAFRTVAAKRLGDYFTDRACSHDLERRLHCRTRHTCNSRRHGCNDPMLLSSIPHAGRLKSFLMAA